MYWTGRALAPKFPIPEPPLTARGLMTCAHPAGRDHARSERKVAGSIRTTKAYATYTVPTCLNMSGSSRVPPLVWRPAADLWSATDREPRQVV